MTDKHDLIPFAGLLATMGFCVYMVIGIDGQQARAGSGNFTNASVAEVKDARGQIVLQGQFGVSEEDDDDIERRATLKPTGVDADAAGEAEVEFARSSPATQEIEFFLRGLPPGATFTLAIDGQDVTAATVDRRGRIDVEFDVSMPGTSGSR